MAGLDAFSYEDQEQYPAMVAAPAPPDDETALRLKQYLADLDATFPMPEYAPEPQFQQTGWQRLLEGLAGAQIQPTDPRSLGQGFLSGLVGGLGSAGSRIAKQRQQFEQAAAKRRAQTDAERLEASRARRQALFSELNAIRGEERAKRTETRKLDETSPVLTPELKAQYPALARLPEGQRVATAVWTEVQRRQLPETPAEARAIAAAERATAAAERAHAAQERAAKLAMANTVNQVYDDRKNDTAIKGYEGIRANLVRAQRSASLDSGFGDIAMIFAFMRALEPENPNAVREGEYKSAADAVGALQKYKNVIKRFVKGTKLTEEGRNFLLEQMHASAEAMRPDYEQANDMFTRRIQSMGGDPTQAVRDLPLPVLGSADSRVPAPPPLPVGQYKPGGAFDRNRPKVNR